MLSHSKEKTKDKAEASAEGFLETLQKIFLGLSSILESFKPMRLEISLTTLGQHMYTTAKVQGACKATQPSPQGTVPWAKHTTLSRAVTHPKSSAICRQTRIERI